MSASLNSNRGGHPSTTTPTPPPWDSPQVVMRKRCPNVFAMRGRVQEKSTRVNCMTKEETSNSKFQHPTSRKIPNTKHQAPDKLQIPTSRLLRAQPGAYCATAGCSHWERSLGASCLVFGVWCLVFGIFLDVGGWN